MRAKGGEIEVEVEVEVEGCGLSRWDTGTCPPKVREREREGHDIGGRRGLPWFQGVR